MLLLMIKKESLLPDTRRAGHLSAPSSLTELRNQSAQTNVRRMTGEKACPKARFSHFLRKKHLLLLGGLIFYQIKASVVACATEGLIVY